MNKLSNSYALLIGVGNDYPETARDATALNNILIDEQFAGYPEENIILLTEKNATRDGILNGFDNLISKINEDSSVMLFYSGHGGFYEPFNQFYLVPNNFDPDNYETTWVKAEELKDKINQINSRRLIFFLDCCHAAGMTHGEVRNNSATSAAHLKNPEGLAQNIDDGKGMSILSSCREDELSWILAGDQNSLFTKCLIEVLKGKHKDHFEEEFVRISEVCQYIFKKVPERQPQQRPYANLQIYDDFVVSYIPKELRAEVEEHAQPQTRTVEKSVKPEIITSFRKREDAKKAILFVHGFAGEGAASFGQTPQFLIADSRFDDWDLFPFGFSEYVDPNLGKGIWAAADDIIKIADYLTTSLKYKFGQYDTVVILAHGAGGLVVQQALINLKEDRLKDISHVLLFGTPSAGLKSTYLERIFNKKYRDLDASGKFITDLRSGWNEKFKEDYPFIFKTIAALNDEFVTSDSAFEPFGEKHKMMMDGSHFSMIKPKSSNDEIFSLITNLFTENATTPTVDDNDKNNVLGNYQKVIDKLLPNASDLDKRGLEQLVFALEELGRSEEAITLINTNPLSKNDSDVMGVLGGRFKRKYLKEFIKSDGEAARKYYSEALKLAQNNEDCRQIYYQAINLAFLSLLINDDRANMKKYAQMALSACDEDTFDSLWRLATLAEANLYLGEIEISKSFYERAAEMAGQREKISIHTNAYTAYTTLFETDNPNDAYIKFLKNKFLS
ncbi:MAG: caspase family protein [Leeuwenhoekiella sp.]